MNRQFGVSTHLFHETRLGREHLVQIAAHGFEAIEVFATRSHFDYRSEDAVGRLAEWLSETRLELHSVHAPVVEAMRSGQGVGLYSNASGNETRRKAALAETEAALQVARRIPYRYLVIHLGVPATAQAPAPVEGADGTPGDGRPAPLDDVREVLSGSRGAGDNEPSAARRSLEEIVDMAAAVGVRVAVEVLPNRLSGAASLARLLEDDLDGIDAGVCLDYGHAHLMGDLGEAIETLSGHLWTTHLHDNGGRHDEHLVPFSGSIDWDLAMMETQKIGYDGTLMFEVAGRSDAVAVLDRCAKARERLERAMVIF
jgi:sugar phosphate isomerase/epimerase